MFFVNHDCYSVSLNQTKHSLCCGAVPGKLHKAFTSVFKQTH